MKQSFSLQRIVELEQSGNTGAALHYHLLYSVSIGLEAAQVFEFGAGGSTVALLAALERTEGSLISCDTRPIQETGLDPDEMADVKNWTFLQQSSLDLSPKQFENSQFDLVFHDGSHDADVVAQDLKLICPYIKRYGLLIVHDTQHETLGKGMQEGLLSGLEGVEHSRVTLPYGYGLTIIRIEDSARKGEVATKWKKVGGENLTVASTF